MDDAKKQMEEMKSKAKSYLKNLSNPFGSSGRNGSGSSQAFRGQGHRLGGSAEPSYSAPAATSNGGGVARKLGPGYYEQQQQHNDFRRQQQERWARERGVAPAQTPYQPPAQTPYQSRGPSSSNPHMTQPTHVIQAGGTLASAAASVKSPTPHDSIKVERESIGTVQVGNLAPPPYSERSPHFDPFSPIIASGTTHRPAIVANTNANTKAPESKGQFQCPICQTWWQSEALVSAHLDDCTGGVQAELAELSFAQEEENRRSPRKPEGHAVEDLDDAVAIFLSGGPSSETIKVLLTVFRNILNAPEEEKYRTLSLGKQKIKETIGSAIGGLKFCESVGFRLVVNGQDKSLIMERPSTEKQERVQAAMAYLDSYNSATATTTAPAVDSTRPSAPPLPIPNTFDRQLKVFYASKERAGEKFEVPDSFYKLSPAEVKNEAAARRKKLEDSQMLIPKSWKEKQAALAKKRFRGTIVRVQLPDGLLVQGFFKPGEPTSSLYEFVASTLKDPSETFDLILPTGMRQQVIQRFPDATGRCVTMEEADLVPKALVKFRPTGPQGYTCLRSECYLLCEPL